MATEHEVEATASPGSKRRRQKPTSSSGDLSYYAKTSKGLVPKAPQGDIIRAVKIAEVSPRARKTAYTMRELGKLTEEQVKQIDRTVPITSNGKPVAWLVPLTPTERRRAEMIAEGRLEPRRREDLEAWSPQPPVTAGEAPLSELMLAFREYDRT